MSVYSMTGFGKGQQSDENLQVEVEIKSVNHRFLDISCKLPNTYSGFEPRVTKLLRDKFKRGRVEIFAARREVRDLDYELKFNEALFTSYLELTGKAFELASVSKARRADAATDVVLDVLKKREVLELVPKDEDPLEEDREYSLLEAALRQAADSLLSMREEEGRALEKELHSLIDLLEKEVSKITALAKDVPATLRERLEERLSKLRADLEIDETRLAQEAAILADRADIAEELARLASHFKQFRSVLKDGGGGRKLEFLVQEMLREINTIGSKAHHVEISGSVVEAKAILEKVREQVQNVE